jgi:hypothetical protein
VRPLVLILACLAAFSCREIAPLALPVHDIDGYGLKGTVMTSSGIPIDDVEVRLWYTYTLSSEGPIDTARPVVTDPTKVVSVAVFTPDGAFVRQLYLNYRTPGPVPRIQWDFLDHDGNFVPSGEYHVRYAFDTAVVKVERRIAQGLPSALTNASGQFDLGPERLPIGRSYDIYTVGNTYAGTYAVAASIDMEFRKESLFGAARVALNLNRLTTAAFTVQ